GPDQARRPAARRGRIPGRAALGRGLVPVLRGRLHARQPGTRPRGRCAGAGDHRHPVPAPVPAARAGAGGPAAGVGAAGTRSADRPARRPGRADRPRRPPPPPGACAVFLGAPSYVGTIGDLAGHAEAAHEAGVPLLVDAAWAAYLGFHPDLPAHAIAAGADGMVTSAHKALPASTQAALVFA